MAYAGAAGMAEEYGLSKLALEYHSRCPKPGYIQIRSDNLNPPL